MMAPSAFSTEPINGVKVINVDDAIHYQHMAAFGAAMTDSSAWLLWDQLSPAARAVLMSQLFGPEGIHLNFIRVPIGASDYTVGGTPYSYDDLPAGQSDPTLANFSIAHDEPYIIPSLLQALRVNPSTQILASPWSPPAWMKANDAFNNIDLSGALLPAYYEPFAEYLVKFIEAYRAQGIPISAITPENEPNAPSSYPGMYLTPAQEAQLVAQKLAPSLAAAGLHPKIYGLDDTELPQAQALVASQARGALAGIAWHCYQGLGQMSALHQTDPAAGEILDECSGNDPLLRLGARHRRHRQLGKHGRALEPRTRPLGRAGAGG